MFEAYQRKAYDMRENLASWSVANRRVLSVLTPADEDRLRKKSQALEHWRYTGTQLLATGELRAAGTSESSVGRQAALTCSGPGVEEKRPV